MAINIRNKKTITGIKVNNIEYKICQLADDTTLFLNNMSSISASISILKDFEKCSGLKLNMSKTVIIPIGKNRCKSIRLPKEINKLTITTDAFKTLGIWFSHDYREASKLNFDNKLQSMENILNIWTSRNLSWKGKVVIIKTLVIPQISHLLALCYCPENILKKIDKVLFNFLWNKKPAKIKRETITSNYVDGGIRMPDIFSVHVTAKISWIKRLISEETEHNKWTNLMWYMLNFEKYLIHNKIPKSYCDNCLTIFHRQLLECWQSIKNRPPVGVEEIINEYIFDNIYICSNNIPLSAKSFKLSKLSTKNIKVKDLISINGKMQNHTQVKEKTKWNISILNYNIICSAIPNSWLRKLTNLSGNIKIQNEVTIRIKHRLMNLSNVNNKALYWEIIGNNKREPTALNTWIDLFPFLDSTPWNMIFKSVHKKILQPYFQTFQYKIVHRTLNCNYNLYKWKIKETPFCTYCDHIDTLEHHLYLCVYSKRFWELFDKWITINLNIRLNLTICEVLLGKHFHNENVKSDAINLLIIYGKWYINTCRTNKVDISFPQFLRTCEHKVKIYQAIHSNIDEEIQNRYKVVQILENLKFNPTKD